MARLIDGEYWIIDSSGQTTYADGDIGDANHEMTAWESAFGVDEDTSQKWYDKYGVETGPNGIDFETMGKAALLEEYGYGGDFGSIDEQDPSKELIAFIRENVDEKVPDDDTGEFETWLAKLGYEFLIDKGASKEFLDWYMKSKTGDARDYAIQHMGWVRVKSDTFQFWKLDQSTLEAIRNFDAWPEEAEFEQPDETVSLEEVSSGEYGEIALKDLFNTELQPYQIKRIFSGGDVRENPSHRVQANSPKPLAPATEWLYAVLPDVLEHFPKASMASQAITNPVYIDYDWIKGVPLTVGYESGVDELATEFDLMRASPVIFGQVKIYSNSSKNGARTGLERAFTELNDTVIDYHARNYAEARNGAAGYAFKTFVDNCFFFRRVLDNFFFIESVAFEDPRRNEYTALINMRPPYPHSETFVIHYNPQEGLASRFSMVLDIGDTVETGSFNQLVRNFFNHIGFDPWDTVDALKREGQGYLANQMLAALMHFKLERT